MRRFVWTLIPVALAVGLAIGFFVRGRQTKTTTVVQIQTQAAPPPATHAFTAEVQGPNGTCLSTVSQTNQPTNDTFTLRRPGNGFTNGDVVGVAESQSMDGGQCNLDVEFLLSPNLGFFVVSDDTKGNSWGPFDSHSLASRQWLVQLTYGTSP
jgi:hypothetical protein